MQAPSRFPFRIRLDSPVTLGCAGLALAATLIPDASLLLRLDPMSIAHFFRPRWYLGLIGHVFAHANLAHLVGNIAMLLLLGPGLERALGGKRYVLFLGCLALLTGLSASIILVFTQKSLIGASGLIFALIFVHSLRDAKRHEVPLTVVLLAVLWGTKELLGLFDSSHVANSAHLNGALWGFLFGMYFLPAFSRKAAAPLPS